MRRFIPKSILLTACATAALWACQADPQSDSVTQDPGGSRRRRRP